MSEEKRSWLAAGCAATLGVSGLCFGLRVESAYRCGPWMAGLVVLVLLGAKKLFRMKDRKLAVYAASFAFALALFQLLGQRLDAVGTTAGRDVWWLFIAAAGFAPAVGWLCAVLVQKLPSAHSTARSISSRRFFWLAFGVVMLCWLPIYLAFYPGVFSYDVLAQLVQGREAPYSQSHPLLSTLLISALYELGFRAGHPNLGIAAYSLLQMMALALCIAYAAKTLHAFGSPRWLCWTVVLLPGLLPYHGILAISTTKDTLFAAAGLLLITFLFEGLHQPERWKEKRQWVKVIAATAMLCLLRNNGWYALLAAMAIGLLLCRRRALNVLCALLAGMVLFAGISAGLNAICQAKSWNTRETLSVPIQQMARVITLHPEWEQDPEVQTVFQGEIQYNPALSDPVKRIFRSDGETPIAEVMDLWWRMLKTHTADCVDATLYLTRGWWDLADISHSEIYGRDEGYMHTNVLNGYDIHRTSVIPVLEGWYRWLVTENGYQQFPVVSFLFAPALWMWLLLGIALYAIYARRADVLLPCLIPVGIVLTALLGPCCLIRYAYPALLAVPVLIGMLCVKPLASDE